MNTYLPLDWTRTRLATIPPLIQGINSDQFRLPTPRQPIANHHSINATYHVCRQAVFEREPIRVFCHTLTSNATVWDVGSCLGSWAIPIATRLHRGSLRCFEPNPANIDALHTHLRPTEATIEEAALTDRGEPLSLEGGGSMGNAVVSEGGEGLTVTGKQAQTVPEDPTHIKIDVEGHAGAVLRGLGSTTPDVVFIEFHGKQEYLECRDVLEPDYQQWRTFKTPFEWVPSSVLYRKVIE